MSDSWTVTARWVCPVDGPPIERGILTVANNRIVGVDRVRGNQADVDFGESIILPGLVNAHTHLDLGALRGRIPPTPDFAGWLRDVVSYRRTASPAETDAAIQVGMDASLLSGTTALGDISATGRSAALLRQSPLRALVFHELIGLTEARADQSWSEAQAWISHWQPSDRIRAGLSPHAPYSVRRTLFARAAAGGLPLAIHFAETPLEEELLSTHGGPLRDFLDDLGAWDGTDLVSGWGDLLEMIDLRQALLIHGNYANGPDLLDSLRRSRGVIYCPRTHAAFGHPPHPFAQLVEHGVNVALGTDSLASNPDLSMLEEMRFLHRARPEQAPASILHMATLAGAMALGLHNEIGALTPGKYADFIVIPVDGGSDPLERLLESTSGVSEVSLAGKWIVRGGALVGR